ncbi:MAG: TonB-dependent receptor [Pseudomonadales bacterium]
MSAQHQASHRRVPRRLCRTHGLMQLAGLTVWGLLTTTAAAATENDDSAIEEVIVTAQRTAESIQDVPIAVTALTGEMLEDKGVLTPSDLQMNAPSLSFTATNFGGSSFSIRGIGNLVIGGESGVSTHINEIAIASNLNAVEFYDLQRVEVLRGPQGTLFGRNATGGAVNFVTKRPDFDSVNGFLDLEGGDYNNRRVKGAVNFPITDNFAVRVAGMLLKRDGYIDNLAYGQVADNGVGAGVDVIQGIDDDIDGRDIKTFRVTGEWAITDRSNLWVMYTNFDEDDDRARITNQICVTNPVPTTGCLPDAVGFESPNAFTGTGGIIFGLSAGAIPVGAVAPSKYNRRQPGFREMHTDFEPVFQEEEEIWAFGFEHEFDRFVLGLTGAYQERDYLAQQDYFMDTGALLLDGSVDFPVSAAAGDAGDDWRAGPCSFNAGTSGALAASNSIGGCTLDADGSVIFAYDQADTHAEYWTGEVKLASSFESPFNFVVGANAYEAESYSDYYVFGNSLDVAGSYPGFFNNTDDPSQPTVAEGWAIFGEAYYDVTDNFRLTLGLRYNEDHREDYGTSVLFNSFDLNAALGGALGQDTKIRTGLAGFVTAGLPLGNQTALAALYGVDAATVAAAEATPANSPERISLATTIPPVPQAAETRYLTGSPTEFDFDEVSGRIGFDWALSNDSMVYAFYSRGYKPGGLNPAIPVDFQSSSAFSFESEKISAFEVGTKNTFLEGAMVLNASLYYYDYEGLQVSRIVNNSSINENIDAQIAGFEAEVFWKPEALPGLQLDASYSWTDTEIDGSESIDPTNRTGGNPDWLTLNNLGPGALTGINFAAERAGITPAVIAGCAGLGGAVPVPELSYPDGTPALWSRACLDGFGVATSDGLTTDLDGNQLPNTPEHNFHLGAGYTWNIDAIRGALTLRWDYYWQGDSFAREFNTRGDEIDSWDQHNASVIYESSNGLWSARAFIRNIADENNVTGHYLTSDTSGFYRNYFLTEPRIYGASVRYDFGG